MTQAEQTERNIKLCCTIIDCAYMLHLPNAYAHDVAHCCISIMQHDDARRFVIGYRDSGVEYLDSGSKLDRLRKAFGPMQLYVFLPNDDPQSSKWTPYKAVPVDETSASRYLLGLSLRAD